MHGINIDTGPRRSRPDRHVRVRGFDHASQVQTMLRVERRRAVHPDRFDELRVPGSVGVGRGHPGAVQRGPATGPKIAYRP